MLSKKKKAMQKAHHSKMMKREDGSILVIHYDEFNQLISQDSYDQSELLNIPSASNWTTSEE